MPVLSVLAYKVRAAVSVAVGALIFIIPVAPGPPGALGGAGLDQHGATAVQPPAGIPSVAGAGLSSVACTARGACTAGGSYQAAGRQIEPMVATQSRGRWSRGTPLVLPAGAATQPYAQVNGIACHNAGNCVAVGDYQYGRSRNLQAFIATESHGRWARAFTPRLPANASSPVSAELEAVACTHDGSCAAVGSYQDSSGNAQPRDGGDRVEGPVRPGRGDHRGTAGRQHASEQLSARYLLPALGRLRRGRRRAEPGGPLGRHVPGQVGRPLAGGVPHLAGRGYGWPTAIVRPERGVVHRQGALQRGWLLPRPTGRQPRRGSLHTLTGAHVACVQDQARTAQACRHRGRAGLPPARRVRVGEHHHPHSPIVALMV